MSSPHYDPFSKATFDDPYPIYKALRDQAPVYHNAERGFWAVSRFEDVAAVSRDWQTFTTRMGVDIDNYGDVLGGGFFLAKDPPDHEKLRNVVRAAFGPRTIRERFESETRREVEALVGALTRRGSGDLAADLCWKLPSLVMSRLLGFPREDSDQLTALGIALASRVVGEPKPPPASDDAGMALMGYFQNEVARRRAQPQDDLLTTIATATIDGAPIGDSAEGMALLLYVGGFENVGCTLTNILYWLERHAEQRDWLAAHPEGIPATIEEALRFDSAQQNFKRTTTRQTEIKGIRIPANQPVLLLYGAANRDERQFERPEVFDIRAPRKRHIAFGEGIHSCLGSPIARLEAQIVLECVLREMPRYRIDTEVERLRSHAVRGFTRLPVVTGAGASARGAPRAPVSNVS